MSQDAPKPPVEIVDAAEAAAATAEASEAPERSEVISEPSKLLRIVSMVRELLDETRQTSIDEAGRTRLRQIYERSVAELDEVLSPDLQEELAALTIPLEGTPSESEIRIAQAQLVGWLEGLFHGIQAAIFSQQMAARAQFEAMRRQGLPAGSQPGPEDPMAAPGPGPGPGQYL